MPTAMSNAHAVPARRLTPSETAATAKRGRKLLRRGTLTHHQLVLLDCFLWCCRQPGGGAIIVSYTALQRLAHMARETVARGVAALERAGLLSRIKRRVRIAWHQGGVRVRQLANAYLLHPPSGYDHCEFGGATVNQTQTIEVLLSEDFAAAKAARAALAAIAERRRPAVESKLLGKRAG